MNRWLMLLAALLLIGAGAGAWAEEKSSIEFSNLKVEPAAVSPKGRVLLSCQISHPNGASAIKHVAADLTLGKMVVSYPKLTDDGENGDARANDGIYSLSVEAPDQKGAGTVNFIAVDASGMEKTSEPTTFVVK